eukprot:SAG22_NODE_2992_length_2044_cov_1.410283_2_plen_131_part_00
MSSAGGDREKLRGRLQSQQSQSPSKGQQQPMRPMPTGGQPGGNRVWRASDRSLFRRQTPVTITTDQIAAEVERLMANDPAEQMRTNEVRCVVAGAVFCICLFVVTVMLMEHPGWAKTIRSLMLLPPPPSQ